MAKKPGSEPPCCDSNYTQKVTGACLACKKAHHACDQERPKCARCVRLGTECEYRLHKKPGRKRLHAQSDSSSSSSSSTSSFPQKRRRYYSESNGTNSDSSNDRTTGKTTRSTRTSTPPESLKKRYTRSRRNEENFDSNDELDGPQSPSAPELLVTMLRAQQNSHLHYHQQQQQHHHQQQQNSFMFQDQRAFPTTKFQQPLFNQHHQQQQQQQQQQPQLLNALLMCLGSREKSCEEDTHRQQIEHGRRQLGYILNRDEPFEAKGKESEGREGFPDERVGLDERYPGPTLEGDASLLYPHATTGPMQNPLDSSVYIPKYNPARTLSTPEVRRKVDGTKILPQPQPQPPFQPLFPTQPQHQHQYQHQHSTNCLPTNNLYILPPPKVLSNGSPPPPHSPGMPFLGSLSPPFPDSPPAVSPIPRGEIEPLPSLSKLLNLCPTAKTR